MSPFPAVIGQRIPKGGLWTAAIEAGMIPARPTACLKEQGNIPVDESSPGTGCRDGDPIAEHCLGHTPPSPWVQLDLQTALESDTPRVGRILCPVRPHQEVGVLAGTLIRVLPSHRTCSRAGGTSRPAGWRLERLGCFSTHGDGAGTERQGPLESGLQHCCCVCKRSWRLQLRIPTNTCTLPVASPGYNSPSKRRNQGGCEHQFPHHKLCSHTAFGDVARVSTPGRSDLPDRNSSLRSQ